MEESPEGLKINLGSNRLGLPGWVNIDGHIGLRIGGSKTLSAIVRGVIRLGIVKYKPTDVIIEPPPGFMYLDLMKGTLPFKDESVKYCFTSHFIEHIPKYKAEILLKEVHRVMKKNGVIRIAVPDLELAVKYYMNSRKKGRNKEKYADLIWGPGERHEYKTVASRLNGMYGMSPYPNDRYTGMRGIPGRILKKIFPNEYYHKWMYDYEEMEELLKGAGFRDIKKGKYGVSEIPEVKELDNRPEISLFVEAIK